MFKNQSPNLTEFRLLIPCLIHNFTKLHLSDSIRWVLDQHYLRSDSIFMRGIILFSLKDYLESSKKSNSKNHFTHILKVSKITDTLRIFTLPNVMDCVQIRFGYLKLTSATPGLSYPCKLRFKQNIAGIFVTDIYRIVGDTSGFKADRKPVVHSRYR